MSESHDTSNVQSSGCPSHGSLRPSGGVSLFGANRGLLGEMKARLRGNNSQSNDGSDSDTPSSPPMSTSPPTRIGPSSKFSTHNDDHIPPSKTFAKGSTSPKSAMHVDHQSSAVKLPSSRRHLANALEKKGYDRSPTRVQSMYTDNPHFRLGEILRNKPSNEPLAVNSAVISPSRIRTTSASSPSSSSTTINTEPLLSSLTKNRVRKPRTRPPTVYWMPNVPSPAQGDKTVRDDCDKKMLREFFGTPQGRDSSL